MAETRKTYTGRFAPTPSGPLHFGSLLAALAGFLDARRHGGRWLLRIDDIDAPRVREGSADGILRTLEACGLHWDGDVVYQSRRLDAYAAAIESLTDRGLLYRCDCPRRVVKGRPYPGTCRYRNIPRDAARYALRLITGAGSTAIPDAIQCEYSLDLQRESGDFVVRRSDGIYAYHLVAVVDDDWQGITDIVRGADLLPSTPPQVYLQKQLGLATPGYAHFPVVVDTAGRKISKSDQAPAVDIAGDPGDALVRALSFLGQAPPASLSGAGVNEILEWAVQNWDLSKVPGQMKTPLAGGKAK